MESERVASDLLRGVGTRLAHSAAVAAQAERVADLVGGVWGSVLVDAAWLHDIGYAPAVAVCGFHPLDGARWLRDRDWPAETCRLVAGHSRARTEAALRGLEDELVREFEAAPELPAAALAWADVTSLPDGGRCSLSHRLADILARYPDGPVHETTLANRAGFEADVAAVEALLASATSSEAGR